GPPVRPAGPVNVLREAARASVDFKTQRAARAEEAAVDVVRARRRSLDREYVPRIVVQSAFTARGTGAEVPGTPSFGNGFWPEVPNWAVGAQISFPVFDYASISAQKRVESAAELSETARYDQAIQTQTAHG